MVFLVWYLMCHYENKYRTGDRNSQKHYGSHTKVAEALGISRRQYVYDRERPYNIKPLKSNYIIMVAERINEM